MRRFVLTALLASAPLAGVSSAQTSPFGGTYRVAFCKSRPCAVGDTANVVVSGTLMFADSTIDVSAWSATVMKGRATRGAGGFMRGPLNACFDLERHRTAEVTYAGIGGAGLASWNQSGDSSAQVLLYQSPDARNIATLLRRGDSLSGSAISTSSYTGGLSSEDIVVGVRIGDWSPVTCAAAVDRVAALQVNDPPFSRFALVTAAPIDTTRKYIIAVVDDSTGTRTPNPHTSPSGLMLPFGTTFVRPGMTMLGVYAEDSATDPVGRGLQHISRLLAAGVPAARITLIGIGGGTSAALAIAAKSPARLDVAMIGRCSARAELKPAAMRLLVISAAGGPAGSNCAAGLTSAATTVRSIPYSATSMTRRRDDWGDILASWLASR